MIETHPTGGMKSEYTADDVARGQAWYAKHRLHVDRLMLWSGAREFPMSGSDIGHPELWKPGAWKWFFTNFGIAGAADASEAE